MLERLVFTGLGCASSKPQLSMRLYEHERTTRCFLLLVPPPSCAQGCPLGPPLPPALGHMCGMLWQVNREGSEGVW